MCKANAMRLRAISEFFDVSASTIAELCGVSRPYVSRIMSDSDTLTGSSQFWRRLEGSLGRLIEERKAQVFDVPGAELERTAALTNAKRLPGPQ